MSDDFEVTPEMLAELEEELWFHAVVAELDPEAKAVVERLSEPERLKYRADVAASMRQMLAEMN